jgi:TrmH family RNA methyltransferase
VGEGDRRRIAGTAAIAAALERGEPLRLIVVSAEAGDSARGLEEPARAAGVPIQKVGTRHFARLCPPGESADAVALVGDPPDAPAREVMARAGAAWLLVGVAYPGNAGFAIRTAEVSGAAGVFLDCDFDHARRREALRASMRADRFLPVHWLPADEVIAEARAAGRRVLAVEDVGAEAPWRSDLSGAVLLVVGGETHGIPEAVLRACDGAIRIPMAGFIRSYNLQAAVAIVAAERTRQLEAQAASTENTLPLEAQAASTEDL